MSQSVEKLAVLFADICGSTSLYENLGDDLARKVIFQCINTMTDEIFAYRGTLIKTIGDEVMATFPSAEYAFKAACSMKSAVDNNQPDNFPLHIRIGFNFGTVIKESGDVFGNTVNVASRVAAITRAGQIMATQEVFDALPADLRLKMRQIFRAEFKGKQDRLDIYQIVLAQEDTMSTRVGIPAYRKPADNTDELILRYHGRSIKVNKDSSRSVVLGRDETCDLVVHNELASRLHIHVEARFDKFILADQSTNGTYVRFSDGNVAHITREEIFLQGNGAISLGQSFAENPDNIIEFSISSSNDGTSNRH